MKTLDTIASAFSKREQNDIALYEKLVLAIANGEELDPARSVNVLRECGKTAAALKLDVERVVKRREAKATLDAANAETIPQKRDAVYASELEARKAYDDGVVALLKKLNKKLDELRAELTRLNGIEQDSIRAETYLYESSGVDPFDVTPINRGKVLLGSMRTAIADAKREILACDEIEENCKQQKNRVPDNLHERRRKAEENIAFASPQIPELEGLIETLEAERATWEARRLEVV